MAGLSKTTFNLTNSAMNCDPFCRRKLLACERHWMSIHHNVAITLYYLSDEGRYRKVANAFGIGRSTVSTIIKEVTDSLINLVQN